jgi:fumarate hydratase class I
MADFAFEQLLPGAGGNGADETPWRLLTTEGVRVIEGEGALSGRRFLQVAPEALRLLSETAMHDIAHYLRPAHLAQLRRILDDPEASNNDKFVALDLLKNANIAAGGVLPMCQDTGTRSSWASAASTCSPTARRAGAERRGVYDAYTRLNLRYSQMAPVTMWEEKNTGSNLPAQIELYCRHRTGHETAYKFLFMAKGGGSANKSYLYQETKAILNPAAMVKFLDEKLRSLGTAACPPYHLAIVIGGTSAEFALKTAKYASAKYLDTCRPLGRRDGTRLPRPGVGGADPRAHPQFRDRRPVRRQVLLPRRAGHPAAAARRLACRSRGDLVLGRPAVPGQDHPRGRLHRAVGVRAGALPARDHPRTARCRRGIRWRGRGGCRQDRPAAPDARDPRRADQAPGQDPPVAHRHPRGRPRHRPRQDQGAPRRRRADAEYLKDHPVYYAGPAKTPQGMASGSFGPTTAGRMDSYVDQFQAAGGSMVMLAKGNRSQQVTDACAKHGGFYLGSIGGPAARLAQDCIKSVEVLEYPELGMEAVWKIEVEDFPAFVVVDDKGNDFFASVTTPSVLTITTRPGLS